MGCAANLGRIVNGACAEGGRGETEGDVNEKGGNGGVLSNGPSVELRLSPHHSSVQGGKMCLEDVRSSFLPELLSGE